MACNTIRGKGIRDSNQTKKEVKGEVQGESLGEKGHVRKGGASERKAADCRAYKKWLGPKQWGESPAPARKSLEGEIAMKSQVLASIKITSHRPTRKKNPGEDEQGREVKVDHHGTGKT